MSPHYRGYLLGDVRRFPAWSESVADDGLVDDTVVYLREDLAIVADPVSAVPRVLWDAATPQWRDFCRTTLGFAPQQD